jgi:2-polyprenyl-3-methyl-5-hydroxy-6-metoxy-1,4-benzoquinol methylase
MVASDSAGKIQHSTIHVAECPACSERSSRSWGLESGEPILKCTMCGSVFFERPISRPHDYETYYPYLAEFDHSRYKWELDQRRRNFRFQLREIERLKPPGRQLVDFGAGPGYFCAVAEEAGWNALAIETSAPAIDAGSTEFGVRYTTLECLQEGSCSVLTAFHVLEHLDAPSTFLRALRLKLAAGGVLVVHVPNRESLSAFLRYWLRRLFRGSGDRRGSLYYPEHITGFTPAGLTLCADHAGFELIRLRQRTMFSQFYDPWLTRNYFFDVIGRPKRGGAIALAHRLLFGLCDQLGSVIGRGDWLVAHFRAR